MKKLYWNCNKGKFVNKFTGKPVGGFAKLRQVEWNETFLETILDLANIVKCNKGYLLATNPLIASVLFSSMNFKSSSPSLSEGHLKIEYSKEFASKFNLKELYKFEILISDCDLHENVVYLLNENKDKLGKVCVLVK